jgi:D-xylose transport system substrate-binding protein
LRRARFLTVLVLSAVVLMACGGDTGVTPGKKIALLLPDNTVSSKIKAFFEANIKQVCADCEVLYSTAKTDAEQQTQATTAINAGANAIVLEPLHEAAAAAIVTQAKAAHTPVVSYDRLVLNTPDLSYYVSFDHASAGGLLATSLLTALGTKANPTVVEINGEPSDPNTKSFKESALAVLKDKVKLRAQYDTPGGSPATAKAEMAAALVSLNYKVDGVLAGNDVLAGAAIGAMKGRVRPWAPVAGQGAELIAIQRIVAGEQALTLYSSTKAEAEAAAQVGYDLAFGITVPPSMGNGKTVNNGAGDIPAVLLTPVVVTKVNIESTVVADGYWTPDQICSSQFVAACATAGIS